jgi:phospholipid/cholesterol/gamma-HCH transport system ATP-binding protein
MSDIKFNNVSFYRGSRCIYDDISLTIPNGKITTILGPSGAGKTTILQLVSGLIKPYSGTIDVEGYTIYNKTTERQFAVIRKKMGFLFQSSALFTHMNVYDNIAFPIRKNTNLSESLIKDIVLMKLQAVGLSYTVDMMPNELSGGMARRVALSRAIALDPSIIMYDEPFTGQDPVSFNKLLKLIKTINESLKVTSIIVSHDIEESMSISDHIIIVADKKVLASDTPDNIKNSSNSDVQSFLKGRPMSNTSQNNDENSIFFNNEILRV